jgi:hypothetical protein
MRQAGYKSVPTELTKSQPEKTREFSDKPIESPSHVIEFDIEAEEKQSIGNESLRNAKSAENISQQLVQSKLSHNSSSNKIITT